MGEAKQNKAREEMRRRERELTISKCCNALGGFIGGLTLLIWFPFFAAWQSYKDDRVFWRENS